MKLLIHPQTSTTQPVKVGNGLAISFHTFLGSWLLIPDGIKVDPGWYKGPLKFKANNSFHCTIHRADTARTQTLQSRMHYHAPLHTYPSECIRIVCIKYMATLHVRSLYAMDVILRTIRCEWDARDTASIQCIWRKTVLENLMDWVPFY